MFKIGDKVLCVDDSQSGVPKAIKRNKIYTISGYYGVVPKDGIDTDVYFLKEVPRFNLFYGTRLKKVGVELGLNTNII